MTEMIEIRRVKDDRILFQLDGKEWFAHPKDSLHAYNIGDVICRINFTMEELGVDVMQAWHIVRETI